MSTANFPIPVPASGTGPTVDISSLVGRKTVTLSGTFKGRYVLYGTHDNAHFAPLMIFDSGGIEAIQSTFDGAVAGVRLLSSAIGSGVAANISGLSAPSDNSFTSFPPAAPGASGPQPAVDLGTSSYQEGLNFIAQGEVAGSVIVEGSQDGMNFNPIGEFASQPATNGLLGKASLEFSPLATADRIRYVRLDVQGRLSGTFNVTIGGSQDLSGSMDDIPADTLVGNNTASPAAPAALTVAQVKTLLNYAIGDLANIAADTLAGNNTASPAAPAALTVAQVKTLLNYAIGDLANIAADTFVGNNTASPGAPAALTVAQALSLLGLDALFRGTAIADSSITIHPGTDHASQYVANPGTFTANRTTTLDGAGTPIKNQTVWMTRRDLTAHTWTISDSVLGTLIVLPASPTVPVAAGVVWNGANWRLGPVQYLTIE